MAQVVVEGAQHFGAQAQIQGEIRSDSPVILGKERVVVVAVLVVEDAAPAEAATGSALQEVLKVGEAAAAAEEELAVEYLREKFVEVDANVLTTEPERVLTLHPAHGIDKVEIVLYLMLIGGRRGPDLKAGERELVDGISQVVGGTVNAECIGGEWAVTPGRRSVEQAVVDPHLAEPEIIHQRG